MASLFHISVGQDIEFKRVLKAGGLDSEMVETIISRPALGHGMVGWLREQLAVPLPELPELFVPLGSQLANVRRWNLERNWGFTDADFASIDLTPIERSGLVVDVIAVYFPDRGKKKGIQRTFEELWDIASKLQRDERSSEYLASGPKRLRLLDGIEHKPGVRRVTIDLGAYYGVRPIDVRGPNSAHAEVLAAAAHFPDWIRGMDRKRVPHVWMPGYQMDIPGLGAWRYVPHLRYLHGLERIEMSVSLNDYPDEYRACPVKLDAR